MAAPLVSFLGITLFFPLFTLLLCALVFLQNLHKKYERFPGPKRESFFWGNAKEFDRQRDNGKTRVEILQELARKYGPVMITWDMHRPVVTITDPKLVKKVLTVSNLSKDPQPCENLASLFGQRFLGGGLATETDPQAWKIKRLAINVAFNKQFIEGLMDNFNSCCDVLVEKLSELADGKTELEMGEHFRRSALDIIGKVAFGIDIKAISDPDTPFYTALQECILAASWAANNSFHKWNITSFEYQNDVIEAVKFLRDFGKKVIDNRRSCMENGSVVPQDVLAYMLKAADEDPNITLDDSLDDFVTLFVVGQDQIAGLLSFILLEILQHPETEEKLMEEVVAVLQGKQHVTCNNLDKLKYCSVVLKETLRLHPPVPVISRVTTRGENVGAFFLPEGTKVQIIPYILQRDPRHWEDPDEFIPERFLRKYDTTNMPHYLPFSLGARSCVGQVIVAFQIKIVISRLLQRFKFRLVPGQDLRPKETLSLAPKDGVKCVLTLR